MAAAFLPATASPTDAFAGPAKHASKKKTKKVEPAPAPAPDPTPDPTPAPGTVSWLLYEEDRRGLVVNVPLEPLPADVVSVAFVAEPASPSSGDPGNLVDIPCDRGKVIREVDAKVFAEAPLKGASVTLPVLLAGPELEPSKLYAMQACFRTQSGALRRYTELAHLVMYPSRNLRDYGSEEVFATPSGPVGGYAIQKGSAVIGYDVDKGSEVVEHLHKVELRGGSNVSIELDGIGEIGSKDTRSYYVPAKQSFVAVGDLGVGDQVFARGGGTARVTRAAEPSDDLGPSKLTVDGPGNFFIHDVLARDAKPAKGDATPFTESETNTWMAAPMSFDCGLSSTLTVRSLPADAKSVVLMVKKQSKNPGERVELTCDEGEAIAELSKTLIDMAKTSNGLDSGTASWLGIRVGDEESGPLTCDAGYSMLACVRGADGKLSPLESTKARYGLAGSSCFIAGTPIATPEGDAAIESLTVGQRIYGYDVEGHNLGTVRVEHVTARTKYDIGAVLLSNGTELHVTSEHPFFVRGLGFVAARDLQAGDRLLQPDGSDSSVERILPFDGEGEVYDVSVDGPHDYFAGGVLVHNY